MKNTVYIEALKEAFKAEQNGFRSFAAKFKILFFASLNVAGLSVYAGDVADTFLQIVGMLALFPFIGLILHGLETRYQRTGRVVIQTILLIFSIIGPICLIIGFLFAKVMFSPPGLLEDWTPVFVFGQILCEIVLVGECLHILKECKARKIKAIFAAYGLVEDHVLREMKQERDQFEEELITEEAEELDLFQKAQAAYGMPELCALIKARKQLIEELERDEQEYAILNAKARAAHQFRETVGQNAIV